MPARELLQPLPCSQLPQANATRLAAQRRPPAAAAACLRLLHGHRCPAPLTPLLLRQVKGRQCGDLLRSQPRPRSSGPCAAPVDRARVSAAAQPADAVEQRPVCGSFRLRRLADGGKRAAALTQSRRAAGQPRGRGRGTIQGSCPITPKIQPKSVQLDKLPVFICARFEDDLWLFAGAGAVTGSDCQADVAARPDLSAVVVVYAQDVLAGLDRIVGHRVRVLIGVEGTRVGVVLKIIVGRQRLLATTKTIVRMQPRYQRYCGSLR